jgi:hypothetical protein
LRGRALLSCCHWGCDQVHPQKWWKRLHVPTINWT